MLAAFCAPLIDKTTWINLYDGRLRCESTLFGYKLSCTPRSSRFALLVQTYKAAEPGKEQWVVCHSSGANVFGIDILKSTPRYEGLPGCLETASSMLDGRHNNASGKTDKLPLSNEGKRAFLNRLLESSRLGKDPRLADVYLVRSSAVLFSYDHAVEPDDFPSVKEALDNKDWELIWEPRTR